MNGRKNGASENQIEMQNVNVGANGKWVSCQLLLLYTIYIIFRISRMIDAGVEPKRYGKGGYGRREAWRRLWRRREEVLTVMVVVSGRRKD